MNKIIYGFEGLVVCEILFGAVTIISGMLTYVFYKAKNGKLRKLMIALFGTKVFVYGGSMIYFLLQYNDICLWFKPEWFRMVVILPMFFTMLGLYQYVRVEILKENNGKLHKSD